MEENTIEIASGLCNGCGLCITVCPTGTIELRDKKAIVTEIASLSCGHCAAVCPKKAIRVSDIDEEMTRYATFTAENTWLPPGKFSTPQLVQLMASRRSCRNYTDRPVERAVLEDLVKIGATAPSGTNSQKWTFTLLPTRNAVASLAEHVAAYFRKLNSQAENPLLRFFLRCIGKGELDDYYRGYYRTVKESLAEYDTTGKDLLFHGSAAAIVVGSKPGASCPAEDALLATQNILLAAHSMGLGSCLIGFAVAAMKRDPAVRRSLGIPAEEVHAVIALGYPAETYQRTAGRKKAALRYFEG